MKGVRQQLHPGPSFWAAGTSASRGVALLFFFFFFFFFGLQDSCLFLSSKKAFRTPDEPEIRRNNGPVCMQ